MIGILERKALGFKGPVRVPMAATLDWPPQCLNREFQATGGLLIVPFRQFWTLRKRKSLCFKHFDVRPFNYFEG